MMRTTWIRKILEISMVISLIVHTCCLSMDHSQEQTIQERLTTLESEHGRLRNSAELQNKYLWGQHGARIALYTGIMATSLIINSQLPSLNESCKESRINDCIDLATKKSQTIAISSLAGGFLLIELVYLLMTLCLTKIN